MATYILLTSLTDHGAETIKEHPERIKAVNTEMEAMGMQVRSQFAVLGPFDFVSIVEAPDLKTVLRASTELSSRGSVKVQTLPAIPIDEFIAIFKG
ncbi:MAG: GYD domain-containing protein [Chloroflexaceae bacterium]|nr:GYD domain-containing protein [Chloroflexaceae bacterium]